MDVAVKTPAPVQVDLNDLLRTGVGLLNLGTGTVNATANRWGAACGCGRLLDRLSRSVDFQAWLAVPIPALPSF